MDSRGPTYSSARQAGQRTILSIDRSPQVMQEQLEVRLMARKSYNLCYPGMHSRQAINTGAGLEGLTTLQLTTFLASMGTYKARQRLHK